jgi:ferredoxin-type protein NapH
MKNKSKKLRTATALAIVVIVFIGFWTNLGIGTISAPGIWDISVLCPLGALGTMLASKTMLPRAVISLVLMVLLIIVFARAFCGWMCPVPLVQKLRTAFSKGGGKKDAKADGAAGAAEGDAAAGAAAATKSANVASLTDAEKAALSTSCKKDSKGLAGCASCASKRGDALDARHFVLGGAVLSTFIFGFPVFCLICPIGLTFATILLLVNLFAQGDVTWTIIVVPAILLAEVVFFRKWCHQLCPLSAFMSLVAKLNRTFKPTIDDAKCIETAKGHACGRCGRACEEGIDPRHPELSEAAWSECTKCRACVDACPTHAITMPFLAEKGQPVQIAANETQGDSAK